jgi:PTH1 family peptidyl-tRNA hydrolase
MHLLVGLGNIGYKYELTRHNFGFLLLEKIITDFKLTPQSKFLQNSGLENLQGKKFAGEVFSGKIGEKQVVALKPHTFMNNSGIAVAKTAGFYKIKTENILVFHDDVDITLGKIKVKTGGGNGGHNGLKSIEALMSKDYMRLRLGIGRPANTEFAISDYVLAKFSASEIATVKIINQKISSLLKDLLEDRVEIFLNKFFSQTSGLIANTEQPTFQNNKF